METPDFNELSLKIRRKLEKDLIDFFNENNRLPIHEKFSLVSITLTNLITMFVYMIFKKDGSWEKPCEYIDELCWLTKEQYKMAMELNKKEEKH